MRHEVSEESLSSWKRTGNVVTEAIPGPSTTRHPIRLPFSDTYVKIILQAHNEFGYSSESVLVIRAIKGDFYYFTRTTTLLSQCLLLVLTLYCPGWVYLNI